MWPALQEQVGWEGSARSLSGLAVSAFGFVLHQCIRERAREGRQDRGEERKPEELEPRLGSGTGSARCPVRVV